MIQVNKDLCLGCGLCADSCPRGAISLLSGQAEIDQKRCNSCRVCLEACPRGAIVETISVSREEVAATVANLERRTGDLLERIESLKR